ncbi:Arginase/deacetylase [Glonium stellatum]|uniref:Arginase/deacetylase n=1 Tax=Glonium stellatum TaxID=574774 RepID=A0A8E2F3L6_9PEZI|nr:Arginase/deacetylase [Glonium stellatum]
MLKSTLHTPIEEKEKESLKAADIAAEHFKKELALHDGASETSNAGTIVIIHDQCYGHRYSRPRTSKSTLSTIVERPERILAGVLGISAAYVRLGERHAEGGNPPHPRRNPNESIPFTIRKTSRTVNITSSVVSNVHGTKWMEELKTMCDFAERKLATTGKELSRTESQSQIGQPAKEKLHEGDLYLCSESLNAFQGALGGVLDAVDAVFQGTNTPTGASRAFVCIRPPGHHCSTDFPSGFCWINNVHVGIEHAAMTHGLTHAAIIDFDLHHGDGSQAITWAHNSKVAKMPKNTPNSKKTSIGYFSLHDINSYPCEWGDDEKVQNASLCIENAHGQSIWNVHLQPWKTEAEFWELYESRYLILIEKARAYLKHHTIRLQTSPNQPAPKAAIFLSAGFDASEWESQGMQRHKVNVPTEFYARFTRDVVRLAEEEGTGVDGRVISVLEGGYSDRALTSGILSHLSGLCVGQLLSVPYATPDSGLGYEMRQRISALNLKDESLLGSITSMQYNPEWWHESRMAELETLVNPPPVVAPKKPRTAAPPTYYSPTQSFSAKVVDPARVHRSVSGAGRLMSTSPSRAPSPPPPEVDWATATFELSKLLIPTGRQTRSCTSEELSEPRIKKERQSIVPITSVADLSGRQLRGRKAKPAYADLESEEDNASSRAAPKVNRRKTIADLPLASIEPPAPRPTSRRLSVASSIGSVSGDHTTSGASSVIQSRKPSVTPALASVNGVQVKKARATPQAQVEITKSRVPVKEPPLPRAPSSSMNKAPQNKENEVDQLTSGLKRISLKLPPREEYEARERQKALEAEKKKAATKTTTKKAAAPRAAKAPTVTRKAAAKETKGTTVPLSAVGAPKGQASIASMIGTASGVPLHQPQPVQPIQAAVPQNSSPVAIRPATEPVYPPTAPIQLEIEPDQLPKSQFTTAVEPLPMTTSPPRPDTPPPPPPSSVPQFIHYNPHASGNASQPAQTTVSAPSQTPLQWLPLNSDPVVAGQPMSPGMKQRADLPVFTANGIIPFAPNPNQASLSLAQQIDQKSDQVFGDGDEIGKGLEKGLEVKKEDEKDIWEVPETPAR